MMPMVTMAQKPTAYFSKDQLPNAINYLPEPPDTASTRFVYDLTQYYWGKSLRETDRGRQAKRNAIFDTDTMLVQFSDVFGYELSATATPAIYKVINNGLYTIHFGGTKAKNHYKRKRPYTRMAEPSLVPEDEEELRHNGSYPSGHTIVGWGMALLLCEINPDAQDAILQLGYEWGQSRVIAGYHWQSDIDAGRMVAAACYARLHTSETFMEDMRQARKEFESLKAAKK
ncbi:MAG: phosphatase PAP2 family protein [Bacteroidales bacterium]|nr:phosphatase PAP2 family protein [Bacteroidales bacterium]